ncbi:hypothetical protein [Actinomadura macra]|uniref:hypothetical protein n=1 Tax=Actinomadura macra TaxID=46164 RepID=UPI0008372F9B|nr:hypothetical protein [Actinomadura macra]
MDFIARGGPDEAFPPLARMLRGGRGGDVRLRLMLSLLWFQTDSRRAVPLNYPSQAWARLLGLDKPETAGVRRVNDAVRWLAANKFIFVKTNPGSASQITVLNETGDGSDYEPPGSAAQRLRDKPAGPKHLYVQIPEQMWTNGYISMLKGAGLAFYLMLLEQYGPGRLDEDAPAVWISPKILKDRYGLSDDTRTRGMKELEAFGLVTVKRQPINPDDFDIERIRNTYTLNIDTIQEPAKRGNLA